MEPEQNPYQVGRYRLSARIATGGMAEVYLGRRIEDDGSRGPSVAVKRLMPHLASDRRVVQMFLNEARITAQVRHPNVVTIIELGMEGTEPFIAMELLEGRSFAELRQEAAEHGHRVPLGITLRVLVEACRGLDAAHRAVDEAGRPLRIVHRDFTPDNIHVGVNGAVKVIDFGIAKADALGSGTEPGILKGKFFYMSPEMIAGKPVDHRADLFAAGVMLYEQLCGRRPFTGLSADEVLGRIAEGRPKPPTAFDPSVPTALELVCLTALAREPAARFDSLEDFIAAIESIGGAAEMATPEQLAAYVDSLFPPDRDPKRLALRRARLADPSHGSTPAPHTRPILGVVDAPTAWPQVSRTTNPDAATVAGATRKAPTGTAASTAQDEHAPSRRRSRMVPLIAGVLALGAVGAGATWFLTRPAAPPAERLARAESASTADAKAAALEGLASDDRASAEELSRAGALLLEAGAHAQALALADGFVARFPKDIEAHLIAARAATELRLGKRAERALEEATALAPKDLRPPLALAELRERQGDIPGALAALATVHARKPGSSEVTPRYGLLLSQSGRLDEAASVLSAWTRSHDDAASLAELGFVRFRQQRVDEAATLLKRAIRKAPKLAVAHYYLGAVLFRQGDTAGAERAYVEADRLSPEDPRALASRCQLHAHTGNTAGVTEVKRALSERFPTRAEALAAECVAVK
ncbi:MULTISPECIES: serine/threonine-protein kinase [Myxococcus]|uniref:serine/threonine-protein kinase n=1 Tax=Myxococcus TaxID=32 RepID=UPI0002DFEF79|nr:MULTISPECIES: serine/threonine-protein kinase [Myxococcus]NOJ56647.1 protein kinase [Myxococcus xanthus]QPM78668.1 protein kinase [Myxococcus xanthus]QVW67739.1 protein kinase [Myxococcus xanthus DZ2]QZZ53938.1 Serine/threonine-protein kinase PknD [Myxococcus xanthus]UEO06139.1 protein kinase [Myxococcus xanthus DZ2]